jgi:glycolate oxidase
MLADLLPLARRLHRALGADAVLVDEAANTLVVRPATADQVRTVVRECAAAGVPFATRGSGAAVAGAGVLIVTSRMRRIIEIDLANRRVVAEPGAIALGVPAGWRAGPGRFPATVGANVGAKVGDNLGGLDVTGLEVCTPEGDLLRFGAWKTAEAAGPDLVGLFVGAQGTLGVATKVVVGLNRDPEAVVALLVSFGSVEDAATAMNAIMAAGAAPAAAELMDGLAGEAAGRLRGSGYPPGAGGLLIAECEGPAAEVAAQVADVELLCRRAGAFALRRSGDATGRAAIWRGRLSLFTSVKRLAPICVVQDGLVPRTRVAEALRDIAALAADAGVRVANVYHAGNGVLHPLVLADGPGPAVAEAVADAILDVCVAYGGSIAVERTTQLPRVLGSDDLHAARLVRRALDPRRLAEPGRVCPTPPLCGERLEAA